MIKSQSFHLTSDNIKHNCFDFIADVPVDEGYLVTVKNKKETRSDAQSALRWRWMGYLGKQQEGFGIGRNSVQWDAYFKSKFLRGLAIEQDDNYAEFYRNADNLLLAATADDFKRGDGKNFTKDFTIKSIQGLLHTSWLNVKSMQSYLDLIDKYCAEKHMYLTLPDEYKWLYKDEAAK